ncbi:hypothetical protein ACFS5M_07920 [Lacinutrix iliipiscaria]|uniref:Uncharacterized protein n=1 Tax=Lacinutrix iliipiscaria TaxID=1230532 RepID=A0ABW5WLM3_9FLAO
MTKAHIIFTIKLLAIILVLSYVLDKVIYYSLNKVSDTVYTGQAIGKLNHYLSVKDTTQVIAFGSSRANHHIDVRKLSKSSFNVGVDGKFIAYSSTLIKLLPKNKKQQIILHIDPNVAFRKHYNRSEIKTLMVKYHRSPIIKKELKKAEQENPLQEFYWSIDYNGLVLGILKNAVFPKYDHTNYSGYDPLHIGENDKEIFKKILERRDPLDCGENIKMNDLYLSYLKEIKTFCDENNKNLILITSPLYVDDCPEDNLELAQILSELNITYYDYTNYFKDNNALEYWKDLSHMSDVAANQFSETLSKDLSLNE